jgi:hypothetical protein
MKEYEVPAGEHIEYAAKHACWLATDTGEEVYFDFNGIRAIVRPGDDPSRYVYEYNECLKAREKARLEATNYRCTRCGGTGREPEET